MTVLTLTPSVLTPPSQERIRSRLRRDERPGKPPWVPPWLVHLEPGIRVLAFDPALLHTGWVCIERVPDITSKLLVHGHGTLNQDAPARGYLGTLMLAEILNRKIWEIVHHYHHMGDVVVIEAPAVAGHRTDSSLIAGLQVWQQPAVLPMERKIVQAQHASSVLCGNPRHDKDEITQAVLRYIPEATHRTWSQHQRDAAAVAIAWLWDQAQGES